MHASCVTGSLSIAGDLEQAEGKYEQTKKELETTLAEIGDM